MKQLFASCGLVFLGVLAPFFFPWPYAALLAFVAGVAWPPAILFIGVMTDLLYYSRGAAFLPYGTLFGVIGFFIALGVQGFIKTRIMSA